MTFDDKKHAGRSAVLAVCCAALCAGCAAVRVTGKAASFFGKTGWESALLASQAAVVAGKLAVNGAKGAAYLMEGKQRVPLTRRGNSLLAQVTFNRRQRAWLIVDTGAAYVAISPQLASRMQVDTAGGRTVNVRMADGRMAEGRLVFIPEVDVGGARVRHVAAVILPQATGGSDGLLGMSFLQNFSFSIDAQENLLVLKRKP